MKNWLHRKFLEPLFALLIRGMAPKRLALCISIAMMVGIIPILGVSTMLCTGIAVLLRLNLPAIQLIQAAMAPLQILLIIPFVRLGEWIVQAPTQAITVKAGFALLAEGIWHAVVILKEAIFHAALAWALLAPPAIYLLYRLLTPLLERTAVQLNRHNLRPHT
jgi:uncharacterized protein (DUF2062 family)